MRITTRIFILAIAAVLLLLSPAAAQGQQVPETIQEAQGFGLQFLQEIPGALQQAWRTQAVPVFYSIGDWTMNIWDGYVFPWVHGLWKNILALFGQEIEKRKPLIEEEFQREKQELQQEIKEKIPEPGKTLWEHIRGFLPGQ